MALRLGSPASTSPPPRLAAPPSTDLLQIATVGCDALVEAEPQALGLTYWFDAAPHGEPYAATVRFEGRRLGPNRHPGPPPRFVVSETIERVIPGSGAVAITARVFDVAAGDWTVTAAMITRPHSSAATPRATGRLSPPKVSASGRTGFGPVIRVRAPGARLGVWPALVTVGAGVALTVQSRLAARAHWPIVTTALVSLLASIVGLLGARIYYLAEQKPRIFGARALLTAGMCIQGFVLAAIATASIGMFVVGIPVGRFLDVTTPGLLFGMSIGRLGCFFGGCCAGRPTASRWGLWSSDRRLGTRRIPTQLLESALALALGVAALVAVLSDAFDPGGAVFVGGMAAYTLGRQLLLSWRDLPRQTAHGRQLTAAAAAAMVLADLLVAVLT